MLWKFRDLGTSSTSDIAPRRDGQQIGLPKATLEAVMTDSVTGIPKADQA
jgi:hypothetical protein